jgi:hypothetical protein
VTHGRSWLLPSPALFTASDPNAAHGKAGVGTVLDLFRGTDRPDWETPSDTGRVYQAEGSAQAADALNAIMADRNAGWHGDTAVVTGLGIDPVPFVKLGVTSCMVECYAQAGDQPYGNIAHMRWQALHDGWPHVIPTLGVYDNIDLAHYLALNGGAGNFKHGRWRGGPLAIYLAEGMTDTGSWPTLAAL